MDQNQKQEWSINDFEIGKSMSPEKLSKYVVALKVIFKEQLEKYQLHKRLGREMEIQISLKHPNILHLYGWFHDSERVYLILEYAHNGELYMLLRERGHFSEKQVATGRLKIADFGWSVQSEDKDKKRKTMCGTLDYLAPEMVKNKGHDYAVDNWTLGILCYEFLYGVPPFEAESQDDTFRRIVKIDLSFPRTPLVSKKAKNLISGLLVKDSSKRLSLQEIMEHPWIKENTNHTGVCK